MRPGTPWAARRRRARTTRSLAGVLRPPALEPSATDLETIDQETIDKEVTARGDRQSRRLQRSPPSIRGARSGGRPSRTARAPWRTASANCLTTPLKLLRAPPDGRAAQALCAPELHCLESVEMPEFAKSLESAEISRAQDALEAIRGPKEIIVESQRCGCAACRPSPLR